MNLKSKYHAVALGCIFAVLPLHGFAQNTAFNDGPVIKTFGQHALVPTHQVSLQSQFKVTFDVGSTSSEPDTINRKFNSLARFINMHVASGVKQTNIHLAMVIHGKAIFDLLNDANYQHKYGVKNPNKPLLAELMANNVKVILCGQSAAAQQVTPSDLIEGVELELSAMTAHALLQQNGYTVNPF